ncbi:RNA polymerase sigma factor [Cohnella herbarum]|uniref:Sigma-70 family RNA polymerase sigma factor n=1 Tax=Cohnella herbarum TaxID=2728023 RepID=A0A7Z2VGX2_9BACL|nr:sigma-70 family RNA polymerase sigma factor [Cohnella herbarum]QJD82963.1 sigma-70 family RNA polymerase sigma factor [Cohnella herbarum]
MSDEMTDLELIERITRKDSQALQLIYERYERPIYTFAFRIVKDAMLAEEVVQELFLRIWNAAEKYDGDQGKLSSWMFTLTRNIAIDGLRRRQIRTSKQVVKTEQLNQTPDSATDTAIAVETKVIGEQVRQAMRKLSPDQHQVVELIYFGGYTQQEVSVSCDIPLGTVKSRVRLAMKALKSELENIGEEGHGYET